MDKSKIDRTLVSIFEILIKTLAIVLLVIPYIAIIIAITILWSNQIGIYCLNMSVLDNISMVNLFGRTILLNTSFNSVLLYSLSVLGGWIVWNSLTRLCSMMWWK